MILHSKHFRDFQVEERSLLHLPDGLLGFEDQKRYILAEIEEFRPFLWLVSADGPEVGFAISDPALFHGPRYEVGLSESDKQLLDLRPGDTVSVFVIVSVAEGGHRITANLKGPVVLNTRNRLAKQVVVYNPAYSVRHPLLSVAEARIQGPGTAVRGRIAAQG